ncbi:MAG: flagellar M-ring protein FliF, partial [Paraglaciecola psychrophila]
HSEQVRAIANLVSSSIPEMALESVTVVDQMGNLLSNFAIDKELAIANKQLDYSRQYEIRLVNRVSSILAPVLGDEGFRAEVSVDLDFTQIEQTDELFNPDMPAIRSEQTVEEVRSDAGPGGVPGALSNQPPAGGQIAAANAAEQASGGNSRRQAVRNYELDRTISHTKHQVGRLRRLSVAVLVDNISTLDAASGESTSAPVDQQVLDSLAILIKDTVGFNAARGDSVNIINSAFIPKVQEVQLPMEELPLWQRPSILAIAKQVGGGLLVLFLAFGVLRPVMSKLTDNAQEIREMEAQRALGELSGDLGGDLGDETVTLSGGDGLLLGGPSDNFDQQLNAVKGLVAEDAGRVAQVVKKWVAAGE